MFDLFRSRSKAVKYMLGGLLMLVALSMVVTLIPGYGTSGNREDPVVAEIGNDVLTTREVTQQLQGAIRNKQVPREVASLYVPQLVDQMITERAVIYEAQRLGFRVTDDDVARAVRIVLPQLFQGGQFAGKEVYAAFLAQQNLTVPEFETALKKQLLVSKLEGLVTEGTVITPRQVEQEYQRRNEKAKIEYFAIPSDKYRAEAQPTADDIKNYFNANRTQFTVAEKRSCEILVADEARVAASIQVSDEELRRAYEANKDQYRTPERVQVRHILLKTTDKPKDEIPKLEKRAEELDKQIKANGGADFADLAKKNSEDTGSAVKGGDLGWVVRGQTVPAFESAAFSLKPKEISNVIKTEYGFHILQVLAKEPARVKPFEEVKDQLASDRKKQQVYDTMQKLADDARAQLEKSPQQADQIAAKLGLELIKVDKAAPGDPLPGVGASRDFSDAISALPKDGVTPVVQVAPTKLAVAVVTAVFPARPSELSEVEGHIKSLLDQKKLADVVTKKAQEALEQARTAGDLKPVAKALGAEIKTTQEFTRNGAAEGIGSAVLLSDAFSKPVGTIFGPVPTALGNRIICKLVSRTPADMTKLGEQQEAIRNELKNQKARDRLQLFQDSIRSALSRSGKIKIHGTAVDRIANTFKG